MTKPTKYLPPSAWSLDNLPDFMILAGKKLLVLQPDKNLKSLAAREAYVALVKQLPPVLPGEDQYGNPRPTHEPARKPSRSKGIRLRTVVKVLFWLGFVGILVFDINGRFMGGAVQVAAVYLFVVGIPLAMAGVGVFGKGDSEGHEGEGWGD
jgi:hypothetical protein